MSPVDATCSSRNCTYPVYESLAVCVQVQDISDLLVVTKIANSNSAQWTNPGWEQIAANGTTAYNASLPNGLDLVTPVSFSYSSALTNDGLFFSNNPDLNFSAISHQYFIYGNAGNVSYPGYDRQNELDWPFRAVEILFYLCVNTYHTEVESGVSNTTKIGEASAPYPIADNENLLGSNCSGNGMGYNCYPLDTATGFSFLQDPSDPTQNFTVDRARVGFITQALAFSLLDCMAFDGGYGDSYMFRSTGAEYMILALYGANFNVTNTKDQVKGLGDLYNSVAIGLTN